MPPLAVAAYAKVGTYIKSSITYGGKELAGVAWVMPLEEPSVQDCPSCCRLAPALRAALGLSVGLFCEAGGRGAAAGARCRGAENHPAQGAYLAGSVRRS